MLWSGQQQGLSAKATNSKLPSIYLLSTWTTFSFVPGRELIWGRCRPSEIVSLALTCWLFMTIYNYSKHRILQNVGILFILGQIT